MENILDQQTQIESDNYVSCVVEMWYAVMNLFSISLIQYIYITSIMF